jgi:hypothetical protein
LSVVKIKTSRYPFVVSVLPRIATWRASGWIVLIISNTIREATALANARDLTAEGNCMPEQFLMKTLTNQENVSILNRRLIAGFDVFRFSEPMKRVTARFLDT